jgi:regulator of RNase E activity RraA
MPSGTDLIMKLETTYWKTDSELFDLARRELYTAVVGDIMDQMGFLHQFLPPRIRPLQEDMVAIGRAMPVLEMDLVPGAVQAKPFGLMLEALDDLAPGEIYMCSGASPNYAVWGELMSARAIRRGAAGAVLDGYIRDTRGILQLDFPTFSFGPYAQDQALRGQVVDFRVPLAIGEVKVNPGDILFGDRDGVCVVPREAEEEIFRRAIEKARGERTVLKAIQAGLSAQEAFATYGIM